MTVKGKSGPSFPMCKLAEYTHTPSSVRRRALVRAQIKLSVDHGGAHRWWYTEARAAMRRFVVNPQSTRRTLRDDALTLRDRAATETDEPKIKSLLASARAIESFSQVADEARTHDAVASPGKRDDGLVRRGKVRVVVSPDVVLLERGTERVVGALKFHASYEHPLEREALRTAATILWSYLREHGEQPNQGMCRVVDVFSPAIEATPRATRKRMESVDASCEEIELWWDAMYESVRADVEESAERRRKRAD